VKDVLAVEKEMPLKDLRPGAIFVTRDGVYAVKTEYHHLSGVCMCILLASGSCAEFAGGNLEMVQEVRIAE
jgi:hypothetical protein